MWVWQKGGRTRKGIGREVQRGRRKRGSVQKGRGLYNRDEDTVNLYTYKKTFLALLLLHPPSSFPQPLLFFPLSEFPPPSLQLFFLLPSLPILSHVFSHRTGSCNSLYPVAKVHYHPTNLPYQVTNAHHQLAACMYPVAKVHYKPPTCCIQSQHALPTYQLAVSHDMLSI